MNLLLFESPFETISLPPEDPRCQHLHKVLRISEGATVYAGFVNGPRARCRVVDIAADKAVTLSVLSTEAGPPLLPVTILVGLPRPHTARKLLYDAAVLGVGKLLFFQSEKGEPSYFKSRLWATEEWRHRLLGGLEQSFATYLPKVEHFPSLADAMASFAAGEAGVALDNYEAAGPLIKFVRKGVPPAKNHTLAIGPENGWSSKERACLRSGGWPLAHLGPRVMRVEGALQAAVAILAAHSGWWPSQTLADSD